MCPARTSPAMFDIPSMRAGFVVRAARSSSSVVPHLVARRAALANSPTFFNRTVLAAAGTPARKSSARLVGANAHCSSSRSDTASIARGLCVSGVLGKLNGTTTGRPVARTSARRRNSRPLPTKPASMDISRASASARSKFRSSLASNHTRCLPFAAAWSDSKAFARTGGSLPDGWACHTAALLACHAASANVWRCKAIAPISAPGYVARFHDASSSPPPVVSKATHVPASSTTVRAARGSSPSSATCALPLNIPALGWSAAAVKPSARNSLRESVVITGKSAARTCGTTRAFQCAPRSLLAARAAAELSMRTHASMNPA